MTSTTPPSVIDRSSLRDLLEFRDRIVRRIRSWFSEQGFIEVHTPLAVPSPGMEPHLTAFRLAAPESAPDAEPLYLHTSPEYAMKKLLACTGQDLYQIVPSFRDEPPSATHRPEFLMLEWYRTGATYVELMDDVEQILLRLAPEIRTTTSAPDKVGMSEAGAATGNFSMAPAKRRRIRNLLARFRATASAEPVQIEGAGGPMVTYLGRRCDLSIPAERRSVRDAMYALAGVDPFVHERARDLRLAAEGIGMQLHGSEPWPWEDVFHAIMLERVEPHLGVGAPVLLYDYPPRLAALASVRHPDGSEPRRAAVAERFELYIAGLELANAFDELTDPAEQRRRFEREREQRAALGRPVYPLDEGLLAALEQMGQTAGIALGLDRLIMLLYGAESLDRVMPFPAAF